MSRSDVVDSILGPYAAAAVASLRAEKPNLAEQMQDYYDSVFDSSSDSASALPPADRWLIAIRTASHTRSEAAIGWYTEQALRTGVDPTAIAAAADSAKPWAGEPRMTAIMGHVDLIVCHPVDSRRADIEALSTAGLSPQAIVALSQVVAYVSYQLRLVAALRALGELQ